MQKSFILFATAGLFAAGVALADHGEETGLDAVDPAEAVTSADLGVEDAGMLPTSRLYFFKEFRRGIQRFFTFDSVKKAELELRFTNEKAAEAKEVQETQPNNEQAIAKALGNYQKSQERLKTRLEALKETSQNPNVDRLLDKVTERTVRHAKLVEEIALKTKNSASLQELAEKVQKNIEASAASGAAKDDPAKFAARLEKSLVESQGGELKHLRSIALIDRINEQSSEGVKKSLEGLREEFAGRLQENVRAVLEKKDSGEFSKILEKIPGDSARHSVILREIQGKENGATTNSLQESVDKIEAEVKGGKEGAKKAEEQLKHAQEKVLELEKKITESVPAAPDAVQRLLSQAKEHVVNAQKALQEKQYGRAFGQATSAEAAARNGLRDLGRFLERRSEKLENSVQPILRSQDETTGKNTELKPANVLQQDSRQQLLERQLKEQTHQLNQLQKQLQEKQAEPR
ncbi:MAG: hypothetical protein A3C82_01775 [Candidatus Wildermuthbacteria bacterium RIFCSPHIGHO2_02_FULL_47_12]|uniref:DUF5667 domain-containing protein n=1 Tax=Candidatus Wildermuthbacteria bacterium RIFCSPHIGHO2_02_FULL_47_12 TaxID=1802451 RepID=A0A1G2R4J0_9BACT|nr:MAG: hypothetical protein A3C82_01775 [Candidatus Wildermuthbacteria bacterium RIFCSPHIGHO2_02_FULL_47_12]